MEKAFLPSGLRTLTFSGFVKYFNQSMEDVLPLCPTLYRI
jgi:hypothetical protein